MTARSPLIPTLDTGRLTLRAPVRADFDAYAAMLADPRTAFMGGPYTRRGAWDLFCNMIANWHLSGFGGWLIDAGDGQVVGEISIWYPAHYPEPELGWTLTQEAEGKGYAHDAARAALNWYWSQSNAESIVSYIHPKNARSEALARRLGATPDPAAPLPIGDTAAETSVFRHMREAAL